jgi:hypothetical protein
MHRHRAEPPVSGIDLITSDVPRKQASWSSGTTIVAPRQVLVARGPDWVI